MSDQGGALLPGFSDITAVTGTEHNHLLQHGTAHLDIDNFAYASFNEYFLHISEISKRAALKWTKSSV